MWTFQVKITENFDFFFLCSLSTELLVLLLECTPVFIFVFQAPNSKWWHLWDLNYPPPALKWDALHTELLISLLDCTLAFIYCCLPGPEFKTKWWHLWDLNHPPCPFKHVALSTVLLILCSDHTPVFIYFCKTAMQNLMLASVGLEPSTSCLKLCCLTQ